MKMRAKSKTRETASKVVKDIRRKTRKQHSAEEKIRIVLEQQIGKFIDYYNHERYHESLDNLTPADVFYGRGQEYWINEKR